MATAGISPEFARIQAMFGGSRNERDPDQNGLPSEDEDGVLKNLAAQTIQPYRPGWAALPGVASSIVGGMAAARLRENNQTRQAADRNAWSGYMKSIMPAAGGGAQPSAASGAPGGMAGPPAVASTSPLAPVAEQPFQPQPQYNSAPEGMPAIAGGGGYQPQMDTARPAIGGMAGAPITQDRVDAASPGMPQGPRGMAGPPVPAQPAAATPQPATGAWGGQPQTGDPRLARFDREMQALGPMLQNPGTRAFAMQRLQALEAARARIDDPDATLDTQIKRAQLAKLQTQSETPEGRARIAEQYGLRPGTPAYQSFVLTGKVGRDEPLSSSDKTRIEKAENEYVKSDDAIKRLEVARDANKNAHQGMFADARAWLGNTLPDWLVPDQIASPESSKATRTYSDLMTQEAVKIMGDDLTGASTDFEMRKYMEIVSDTSKPREIRAEALNRMIERGERTKNLNRSRVQDIRGGDYFKKGYEPGGLNGQPGSPVQSGNGPVRVGTPEEAAKLPPGTEFVTPDGQTRIRK